MAPVVAAEKAVDSSLDGDVEVAEIGVDAETAHFGRGRLPISRRAVRPLRQDGLRSLRGPGESSDV